MTHQELVTIRGVPVEIPDPARLTHLQFRRFAGCPVCNLHLRFFVRRNQELRDAGVSEVVVFHSKKETMMEFQGQLPFAAVADPEKKLYAQFGADRRMSPLQYLNPRTWWAGIRAIASARSLPGKLDHNTGTGEDRRGLPSDFLIDKDARVVAVKYGRRVDDHWSVDEVLSLARHRP